MQRFWRFHWSDCPPFCADNAYSALWGSQRSADGSRTRCGCDGETPTETVECDACRQQSPTAAAACRVCDGDREVFVACPDCAGTGWQACVRGYSCFTDPDQLIDYLTARNGLIDDSHGEVIEFDGHQADTGYDDEPTVIPVTVVARRTWTRFLADRAAAHQPLR